MPVATVDDVATSLGRPITEAADIEQVNLWLSDAEMQIRLRLGDVTLLDQDALAYVEREAVVMKVKRPDPAQTVTISVDDGSVSRAYDKDTGQVTILPEWWNMLAPDIESVAFSTRPGFEPDTCCDGSTWWPIS